MEKEYYDAQIRYINEIRSIRHDMQAHLIVLQYYLESENYEKAKAYLGDMKKHQPAQKIVFKDTGNDLVNAIVSDTLGRSKRNITFHAEGLFPSDFIMSEYDICTLFSNLLSNAREACEKLKVQEPCITMRVIEDAECCLVLLQNPVEWKVETDASGLVSSKADKSAHGYGTKNMIKVVKQYGGKIDFLITESSFRVEITLPNKR